jgi:hypothetical protein
MTDTPDTPDAPSAPTYRLGCRRCGHVDEVKDDAGQPMNPAEHVLTCDVCQARIAYGELQPRVIVEPHTDRRYVLVQIGETSHALDLAHAAGFAKAILSILPDKLSGR